jgi:hypothetical protein
VRAWTLEFSCFINRHRTLGRKNVSSSCSKLYDANCNRFVKAGRNEWNHKVERNFFDDWNLYTIQYHQPGINVSESPGNGTPESRPDSSSRFHRNGWSDDFTQPTGSANQHKPGDHKYNNDGQRVRSWTIGSIINWRADRIWNWCGGEFAVAFGSGRSNARPIAV